MSPLLPIMHFRCFHYYIIITHYYYYYLFLHVRDSRTCRCWCGKQRWKLCFKNLQRGQREKIIAVGRIEVTQGFADHFIWKNCRHKTADKKFMINEVMTHENSYDHNWQNKTKRNCKRFKQITFLRLSWVPEQCTGIFKVLNAWTIMWKKMMKIKAGFQKENSNQGLNKRTTHCSMEGGFEVLDSTVSPYLKLTSPIWIN